MLMAAIRRFATHRYTSLVTGVLVIVTGILEIAMLPEELREERRSIGSYGLIVMGVVVLLKAVAGFFKSVAMFEGAIGSSPGRHRTKEHMLHRIANSPYFEGATAVLLLAAGIAEAAEVVEIEAESQVWHFGLILVAASMIARALSKIIESTIFAEIAEGNAGRVPLQRAIRLLRAPQLEFAVGIALVFLGGWEQWLILRSEYPVQSGGHHGVLAMGIMNACRYFPDFTQGLEFTADVELEKERGRNEQL